jgi:micrococcal nuclease
MARGAPGAAGHPRTVRNGSDPGGFGGGVKRLFGLTLYERAGGREAIMNHDKSTHRAPPRWRRTSRRRGGRRFGELRLLALGAVLAGLGYAQLAGDNEAAASPSARNPFGLCDAARSANCVVDGDTFWLEGEKIRVADIDTPETHPPRCAREAELGERATRRMQGLLNEGPFELAAADRDQDRYGRKLRIVTRDGRSLGDVLVSEGLARPYAGGRRSWCGT